MKAITIYQPWASLLACGAKKYETRSWATSYRGKIAIHAGKKDFNSLNSANNDDFWEMTGQTLSNPELVGLPYGAVIATAELINCWYIAYHPGTDVDVAKYIKIGAELDVDRHHPDFHKYIIPTKQEQLFGDWTPGRYAWEFANMTMLPEPIPAKGKQRIWEWSSEDE